MTKEYEMPVSNTKEILLVRVGSDERPAKKKTLESISALIKASAENPELTVVSHHALEFEKFKVTPDQRIIVKVGSEERPTSHEDLRDMQVSLAEASASKSNQKIFVTHHGVNIDIVDKCWFEGDISIID